MTATAVLLLLAAYFIGSIPFGILVGRGLFGVDPREVGSGNIGTVNSLRALGKVGGALVLVGDVIKGIAPTLVASTYLHLNPWLVAAIGLATIVGHNWSIFLRFGGGKGVATGLGVVGVLAWQAALAFAAVWLAAVLITRYASLASILGSAAVPLAFVAVKSPLPYVVFGVVALVFVMWRHAANIQRLIAGTELKLGNRSPRGAQ
ncbi:MAG TPA: glycerol-3-phosphate 1-O-acyltransferase PlsY [Candidatus Eremiobacteraceae bacterium]|nr:glycerol-3-phosphate 1-O-acyltransferase PlsY [Candidatus Eremiobacteraceae bacterium]